MTFSSFSSFSSSLFPIFLFFFLFFFVLFCFQTSLFDSLDQWDLFYLPKPNWRASSACEQQLSQARQCEGWKDRYVLCVCVCVCVCVCKFVCFEEFFVSNAYLVFVSLQQRDQVRSCPCERRIQGFVFWKKKTNLLMLRVPSNLFALKNRIGRRNRSIRSIWCSKRNRPQQQWFVQFVILEVLFCFVFCCSLFVFNFRVHFLFLFKDALQTNKACIAAAGSRTALWE